MNFRYAISKHTRPCTHLARIPSEFIVRKSRFESFLAVGGAGVRPDYLISADVKTEPPGPIGVATGRSDAEGCEYEPCGCDEQARGQGEDLGRARARQIFLVLCPQRVGR